MSAAHLTRREKLQTLAGMALAMFLAALDQTVVATAGPEMQRSLGMDASLYAWITTAYLVSSTVLVPVYGKLSDLLGRKKVIVFGVIVFVGASVLCGVAQSAAQLIAFRALQGVGSASLFTSAFAVIADLFPPAERGRYSGLFGAVFGVSSLVGPLLGGFITDHFGWHWVFFINLPLGAIALGFIVARMPPLKPQLAYTPRVDVPGAVLLAVGVVPLLVALTLGKPEVQPGQLGYLWTDWPVVTLFVVAALGLGSFVWWQLRAKEPLVDLRLFRNPTVRWGLATTFLMGGAFLTPMVFLPLFMVNVVGVTATQSGLTISPLVLGVVAGNVLSGQLVSRFGRYKPLMLGSMVLQLAGFAVMAFTLSPESTQGEVTVKMVLLGLGLGPSMPLYTIAIQNAVEPRQLGVSTAMVTFFRQMGSTVGIAVVGSLFAVTLTQQMTTRLASATAGLPPELVQRFTRGGGVAPTEEGAPMTRFDAVAVKRAASQQLDNAKAVAVRALDGEALARQLVLASPLSPDELKSAVEDGGLSERVRARYTVVRAKLRRAAESDDAWQALRRENESIPPEAPVGDALANYDAEVRAVAGDAAQYARLKQRRVVLPVERPSSEASLVTLDASLEAAAEDAVTAARGAVVQRLSAQLEAERPKVFATIDAVDRGLREAFTEATRMVYRLAMVLAVLGFLLTLPLPQHALRTSHEAAPPVLE